MYWSLLLFVLVVAVVATVSSEVSVVDKSIFFFLIVTSVELNAKEKKIRADCGA